MLGLRLRLSVLGLRVQCRGHVHGSTGERLAFPEVVCYERG